MRSVLAAVIALFSIVHNANAQTIPAARTTNWSNAGLKDTIPAFPTTIDITAHGGTGDGVTANDTAFLNALAALNNQPGTIYFPAGNYLFKQTMNVYMDSLIIKGDGTATKLMFDLGGSPTDMISINGSIDNTPFNVTSDVNRNSNAISVANVSNFAIGDYIMLSGNDSNIIFSSWAYGSVGQILQITAITGNSLTVDNKIRRNYPLSNKPIVKKITPAKSVGIECMYVERKDATSSQTNNINFVHTANCWVTGVESYMSNFAHVAISYSTHVLVRGNYFHHAHAYGGGGQAYGALVQYTSGDCLIENNIFEHLRHSMLIQAGANGNVFAYNYSFDPYWTQPPFPTNSGGDMVCHGNYPYLNLFEGNIGQSIVVDDSHGINGPFNTFFRNRAELYGIFTNANPASDSVNYVGNEITNTSGSLGLYLLNGNGHFEHGNNVKSIITPAGSNTVKESSLYLSSTPGYWFAHNAFPSIGAPHPYKTGRNTAKDRYDNNLKTDCINNQVYTNIRHTRGNAEGFSIAPNPFTDQLVITSANKKTTGRYYMYNLAGQIILTGETTQGKTILNCSKITPGIYMLEIQNVDGYTSRKKLVKTN